MAQKTLDQTIQSQEWLDQIAEPIGRTVSSALSPGPIGTPLRNALHGTWLGHPLHPAVTDFPVGSWTAAFILDILSYLPFARRLSHAADAAISLGLVGALAAIGPGLADWSFTRGRTRRLGMAHALSNITAASLYGSSVAARLAGNRETGRTLAMLGFGVASLGAYLGGELVYRCGLTVNREAFQQGPSDFVDVLPESQLQEGQMKGVLANGMPVLLARLDGQIYAMGNTCSHMGCPLSDGNLEGEIVTCHCHGSQFRVTSGEAVRGPASISLPRFEARMQHGQVQVRQVEPVC